MSVDIQGPELPPPPDSPHHGVMSKPAWRKPVEGELFPQKHLLAGTRLYPEPWSRKAGIQLDKLILVEEETDVQISLDAGTGQPRKVVVDNYEYKGVIFNGQELWIRRVLSLPR